MYWLYFSYVVSTWVLAIPFCFFAIFDINTLVVWCTSKSVNNDITVTEIVKARTVVLHRK